MSEEPEAAPRPWRLEVKRRDDGRPRAMAVYGEDGSVVEHRMDLGQTPESFARHIANARFYVDAVNERKAER